MQTIWSTRKSNMAVPGFLTRCSAITISADTGIVNKSPPNGPNMSLNVCQNHLNTTPASAASSAIVTRSIVVYISRIPNRLTAMITIATSTKLMMMVP